jgi:hypothetical protein
VRRSSIPESSKPMPSVGRITTDLAAESDQVDDEEAAITRSTVPLSRQSTLRIQCESEISSTPPDIEIEEPQGVQRSTTRCRSLLTSLLSPVNIAKRTISSDSSEASPPDESVHQEQLPEAQRNATCRRSSVVPLSPTTMETVAGTSSFHSHENSPPNELLAQLRRRLSEIEIATSSSISASRTMSPVSSSSRIVGSVSPPMSSTLPFIEIVHRVSTRQPTAMRSRQPTVREPARESTPVRQSPEQDTSATPPPVQTQERVLSSVTSISNGSEPVRLLSLDQPAMTSSKRPIVEESDLDATSREPGFSDEFLPRVEDRKVGSMPLIQRVRRTTAVLAEPVMASSRRPTRQEPQRSTVFSTLGYCNESPPSVEEREYDFLPPV